MLKIRKQQLSYIQEISTIEKKLLKIYLKEIRKLKTKVKMGFSSIVVRENIFIDKIVLLAIESCV